MMRHHLHMPSYFLGTFTEYPYFQEDNRYFLSLKGMPKDNEKG